METSQLPIGYQAPRWSAEIADCSMPMTFDQYSMCGYGCVYCFAVYQKSIGISKKNFLGCNLRSLDVNYIKKVFAAEPGSSQFADYVKSRKVMQWGSMADPFCPIEKKYGVGLKLLRFFREINYPIRFSTKSVWWLDDPRYIELFKDNPNWYVMVSIITNDEEKAHALERGTPTVRARLEGINKLSKLNIGKVILRLRPYMIGISSPGDTELITAAGEAGAQGVSTEFFCLEQRSMVLRNNLELFNRLSGIDYWDFYKRFSYSSGYLRLNRNVKREAIDRMQKAAHKAGMTFSVSDAHFKERCKTGSCCGLPPTANYSRGQFCEALRLCRLHGRVTWGEISKDMEHLKGFLWRKADGYNTGSCEKRAKFHTFTMFDYMRWLWNSPKNGQSPYTLFEGIMKPVEKDAEGNLIYEYDTSRE